MIDKFNNGHSSFPEIERLTQKRIFFGKFHFSEFICLLCPIMLESLKTILRAQILK